VPEITTKPRPGRKNRPKTRWTREFKLQALSRMAEAPDVTALASDSKYYESVFFSCGCFLS
jgi:hypothetical protein